MVVLRLVNPGQIAEPQGGYSHGVATEAELLFISGQTPEQQDGTVATDPGEQLRQTWAKIGAVLAAAGADFDDLVR